MKTKSNNQILKEVLSGRDKFFKDMSEEVYGYSDYDDEQLIRYNRFIRTLNSLNQFEKDIYYLRLFMSSSEIADLYAVSDTYIYRKVKEIKDKLDII